MNAFQFIPIILYAIKCALNYINNKLHTTQNTGNYLKSNHLLIIITQVKLNEIFKLSQAITT